MQKLCLNSVLSRGNGEDEMIESLLVAEPPFFKVLMMLASGGVVTLGALGLCALVHVDPAGGPTDPPLPIEIVRGSTSMFPSGQQSMSHLLCVLWSFVTILAFFVVDFVIHQLTAPGKLHYQNCEVLPLNQTCLDLRSDPCQLLRSS